jgi:DNA primase
MPFFNDEGVCVCYSGRYFGPNPDHPKYLTFGERALTYPFYSIEKDPATLVVVEDYLSAIKVGRSYAGWAMLGATIPPSLLIEAVGCQKRVAVWLDADKASVASRAVLRASLSLPWATIVRITTPKDPKEYHSSEIKHIVELSFKKGL